ncbi:tetratricopeptide repeat protein [bacterium]|nr:tetratricopeptide repeat protein [bacterium]
MCDIKRLFFVIFQVLRGPEISAQERVFIKEYRYQASEMDSHASCRTIASVQLRAELLNEIGVYIQNDIKLITKEVGGEYTQDFNESISTFSAGVTKFVILDESWNGKEYWLKASITIDQNEFKETLIELKENEELKGQLKTINDQLQQALLNIAELQKSENKNSSTETSFNNLVNTLDVNSHLLNGSDLKNNNDLRTAILEYDQVLLLDQNNPIALLNRGILKAEIADFSGAINDFNTLVRLEPDNVFGYFNRGMVFDVEGRYKEAIKDFNRAIELRSDLPDLYNSRGLSHFHIQDLKSAIKDYSRAIELDKNSSIAYYNRGQARYKQGQFDMACNDWKESDRLGFKKAKEVLSKRCN